MSTIQAHPQSIYTPKLARIESVKPITGAETLFHLKFLDGAPLGHQPGQFVEVSVFGVGEAPITIASAPAQDDYFEICVRRAGNVTSALHRLDKGAVIGIRGPLGRPFPLESLYGLDILIVAGGIGLAPLRPVIQQIVAAREKYNRITILYGMKHPREELFGTELAAWGKMPDIYVRRTIDKPAPGWDGHVGVVTTYFPELEITPRQTAAIIVGPPVMYKFVLLGLSDKGIPDHRIFLSLERRMKCGVGKCGHCQINGVLTCQQGPTFCYSEIKELREAIS